MKAVFLMRVDEPRARKKKSWFSCRKDGPAFSAHDDNEFFSLYVAEGIGRKRRQKYLDYRRRNKTDSEHSSRWRKQRRFKLCSW